MAAIIFFSKPVVPFRTVIRSTNYKHLLFSIAVGASSGVLLFLLWLIVAE
jgi:hypothetical protein